MHIWWIGQWFTSGGHGEGRHAVNNETVQDNLGQEVRQVSCPAACLARQAAPWTYWDHLPGFKSCLHEKEPGVLCTFYVSFVNLTTTRELWGDFCSFWVNKSCWGWNHSHQFQLEAQASPSFGNEYESFWPEFSVMLQCQEGMIVAPSSCALWLPVSPSNEIRGAEAAWVYATDVCVGALTSADSYVKECWCSTSHQACASLLWSMHQLFHFGPCFRRVVNELIF